MDNDKNARPVPEVALISTPPPSEPQEVASVSAPPGHEWSCEFGCAEATPVKLKGRYVSACCHAGLQLWDLRTADFTTPAVTLAAISKLP